jgi:hypothetical protein
MDVQSVSSIECPFSPGVGWHVPERSEGRGGRSNHALRYAQGRATQSLTTGPITNPSYSTEAQRSNIPKIVSHLRGEVKKSFVVRASRLHECSRDDYTTRSVHLTHPRGF